MTDAEQAPEGMDITRPSAARMYDYYLGGTANYQVDRDAVAELIEVIPEVTDAAEANRGFLRRSVRYLAEHGIRQFIDLGAGLPTQNNTHQVAQAVVPEARVIYVDIDQGVLAHARSLLPTGDRSTGVVRADLRNPDEVLNHPELRSMIDFSEPVGLLAVAVIHFVSDDHDPKAIVRRYMERVPSGSYLALSHLTLDRQPPRSVQSARNAYVGTESGVYPRSDAEIVDYFDGLEIVPPYAGADPELVFLGEWGAEDIAAADSDGSHWGLCALARKP